MRKINKEYISQFKQRVHRLNEDLKRLCMIAGHEDLLLSGTPVMTYKTCGKPGCKCQEGGESRHGPYMAVQVRHDGGQRNLTLKKSEKHYFEMAKHYQQQQANRQDIVKVQEEILKTVDEMIRKRTIWDKE